MTLQDAARSETDLLLIAGRAGAGKTAVSVEVSSQLKRSGVGHCRIDGDWLDLAFPQAPSELFDRNFRSLWRNYQAFGCTRLIYSNWASIKNMERLVSLMGVWPRIVGVLLLCSDENAVQRLGGREAGLDLQWHLDNLKQTPVDERDMDRLTPDWVTRVHTDERLVQDVASEVVSLTHWARSGKGIQ